MAIVVEMQNTGDPELQRDVVARIEHVLSDSIGDWHILIGGSQGMFWDRLASSGLIRWRGARENTVPVLLLPSFLRLCRAVYNITKALLLRGVSSQPELTVTGYLTIARQP